MRMGCLIAYSSWIAAKSRGGDKTVGLGLARRALFTFEDATSTDMLHVKLRLARVLNLLGFVSVSASAATNVECWDGDCLHNGWTIQVRHANQWMDVACRAGDCATQGWIAEGNAAAGFYTQCKERGCFIDGWYEIDRLSHRLVRQITCQERDGAADCLRFGWTTYESNVHYRTTCRADDCRTNGWDTILPGYMLRTVSCHEGSCFTAGWTEAP